MEFNAQQRRQALAAFIEREKLKVSPWEKEAKVGDGTLRKFLQGDSETLTDRTYARLATAASTLRARAISPAELQGAEPATKPGGLRDETPEFIPGNVVPAMDAPPRPLLGEMANDVPLYGTAMGGDGNSEFELNGTVIGTVYRPPGIVGRKDVFALNVVGDSMTPWRRPNGLIYLEHGRGPSVGDHVVVEFRPIAGSDVRQAVVKLLVAVSGSKLRLGQYKPAREFEVERKNVHRLYRVMEWDELLKGGR